MKNIVVNFYCIEISEYPFSYKIESTRDTFLVRGDQSKILKDKMNLEESVEYLLRGIRDLRAIYYFDSAPHIGKGVDDFFLKSKVGLPEIYKTNVNRLCHEICSGQNNYTVYGRTGDQFHTGNVIYFDSLFLKDIDDLNEKLKLEF